MKRGGTIRIEPFRHPISMDPGYAGGSLCWGLQVSLALFRSGCSGCCWPLEEYGAHGGGQLQPMRMCTRAMHMCLGLLSCRQDMEGVGGGNRGDSQPERQRSQLRGTVQVRKVLSRNLGLRVS